MSGRVKRAALAALAEIRAERNERWSRELAREGLGRAHCILEGRELVAAPFLEWGHWFEHGNRVVARTETRGVLVSTVCLGLDHQWGGGEPLFFETMVFQEDVEGQPDMAGEFQARWSTYADAEAGHAYTVALVESGAPLSSPGADGIH